MRSMITATFAVLLAAAGFATVTAPAASAANETASADLTLAPQSGTLYKSAFRPANFRVGVEIKAPFPGSPKVQPTKRIKVTFPSNMKFTPKSKTPVCRDNKVGPNANLNFGPNTIIARCPNAVLGNGTAGLYLSQNQNGTGPTLTDPVLVVFNGGRTNAGLPKIKIYGYSGGTGVGIYMHGVLNRGVLNITIPRLSFDSSVGDFNLNIPGRNSKFANRRGKDRTYVQARCGGRFVTNAQFTLGSRDTAGQSTTPESVVNAPTSIKNCHGAFGRPRLGSGKVRGSKVIRSGGSKVYRVRVRNTGTAVAKGVRIKTGGRWVKSRRQRVSKVKPGHARTVKVRVRLTRKARKGKRTVAKFRITAKRANAKVVRTRVAVR